MSLFYFMGFAAFCTGVFLLLDIKPTAFASSLKTVALAMKPHRKLSMKEQIKRSVKKKELRGIWQIITESKSVLELTHRMDRLPKYVLASVVFFTVGVLISLIMGNYFLTPVLAGGLALVPWLMILATATRFKRQLNDELETALNMITSSYNRTENILVAIRENVDSLQYPVKEVFEKFLIQSSMISTDTPALLEEMKNSIDNTVFKEWVDQIILCQDNRTLKSTLQPIVGKLSEVREVSGDLNNMMYEPLKEFLSMAVLTIMNFPLFLTINIEWYNTLMHTTDGQLIVAVIFIVIFISLIAVVRSTRPVEYRR